MKKILLSVAVIASAALSAQQLNLLQDQNDVNYGYAEIDYINSKTQWDGSRGKVDATFTIKDINLNPINDVLVPNNGSNVRKYLTFLNNDKIAIVPTAANNYGAINTIANGTYRLYDLKENKLSQLYSVPGEFQKNELLHDFYAVKDGFLALTYKFKLFSSKNMVPLITAIDNNNQKKWDYQVTPNTAINASSISYQMVRSNDDNIAMLTRNKVGLDTELQEVIMLDSKTGKENVRKIVQDKITNYYIENAKFEGDKLYAIGDTTPIGQKDNGLYNGFFVMNMDAKGEMKTKQFTWYMLKKHFDINEKGYVKDKGYIFVHDFAIDPKTKNIILIGEYFHKEMQKFFISNFIFFELDPEFNIKSVKEIEKYENGYKTDYLLEGSRRLAYQFYRQGWFDYMFVNALDNNSGLAFFYSNQKQRETLFRKGEYSYGIVTYKDGTFGTDKLEYDSKSPTSIMQGKPGSFIVIQYSKEGKEIRQERINH